MIYFIFNMFMFTDDKKKFHFIINKIFFIKTEMFSTETCMYERNM